MDILEQTESLRKQRHYTDEADPTYSCPKSSFFCGPAGACDCDFYKHNATIDAISEAIKLVTAALEAVEWLGTGWGEPERCPWCKQRKKNGHAPDCQRQVALRKAKGE